MDEESHITEVLQIAFEHGSVDGAHHKQWVIDQMVQTLLKADEAYKAWCKAYNQDGYAWDQGIAP